MADFNKVLDPGDIDNGFINCVVEIPQGSMLKVEWDRKRAVFMLDRVDPRVYAKPINYGFIPQTLDEDGDELDVLLVTPEPMPTGVWTKAKILGVVYFMDDGEVDDKIVCVPADDRNSGDSINSLADLGKQWQRQIEEHFNHLKDLKKPGSTKVKGWGDIEEAKTVIKQSIARYTPEQS
jgi:inorganic pyrophosphatase